MFIAASATPNSDHVARVGARAAPASAGRQIAARTSAAKTSRSMTVPTGPSSSNSSVATAAAALDRDDRRRARARPRSRVCRRRSRRAPYEPVRACVSRALISEADLARLAQVALAVGGAELGDVAAGPAREVLAAAAEADLVEADVAVPLRPAGELALAAGVEAVVVGVDLRPLVEREVQLAAAARERGLAASARSRSRGACRSTLALRDRVGLGGRVARRRRRRSPCRGPCCAACRRSRRCPGASKPSLEAVADLVVGAGRSRGRSRGPPRSASRR